MVKTPINSYSETIPGNCMLVFGVGVLILGEPRSGKSDLCLELIEKKHVFIADDLVSICSDSRGLIASSPPNGEGFLYAYELGVLNISEIFGQEALGKEAVIEVVVKLSSEPRAVALSMREKISILNQELPLYRLSSSLKRPRALLVEMMVQSFLLQKKGYNCHDHFIKKQRSL